MLDVAKTDAVNNMKDVRYHNVHFHYILISYSYRICIIQYSSSYGAHIFEVVLNFMLYVSGLWNYRTQNQNISFLYKQLQWLLNMLLNMRMQSIRLKVHLFASEKLVLFSEHFSNRVPRECWRSLTLKGWQNSHFEKTIGLRIVGPIWVVTFTEWFLEITTLTQFTFLLNEGEESLFQDVEHGSQKQSKS